MSDLYDEPLPGDWSGDCYWTPSEPDAEEMGLDVSEPPTTWSAGDGTQTPIAEMSGAHLANTINMMSKWVRVGATERLYQSLRAEMDRREQQSVLPPGESPNG